MKDSMITAFNEALSQVSAAEAAKYLRHTQAMVALVDEAVERPTDFRRLLGYDQLGAMRMSHTHHAALIDVVLATRSGSLLVDTVIWAYRSYISRGFSPDYFPVELRAWQAAVLDCLGSDDGQSIAHFYELMIRFHRDFLALSVEPASPVPIGESTRKQFGRYLAALLRPSAVEALELTRSYVTTIEHMRGWWLGVIRPAMHEIGRLWETGAITVDQEHAATSVTQRVMAVLYPMVISVPRDRGRIVFAVSPGDMHEIGARTVSDLLESRGWQVVFLGSGTSAASIANAARNHRARFLCLSTSMPLLLGRARDLVESVHQALPGRVKVVVGGQAYRSDPRLSAFVGADCCTDSDTELEAYLGGPGCHASSE